MSDDPVLPELDARAASAASALQAEVAGFDLALEPPRRSGHRGLLAAAAVLLVVALVAGAAWLSGGDDGDDVKTTDRPAPLYLFPDHVPEDLQFQGATDLGAAGGGETPFLGPADVYADAAREEVLITWTAPAQEGRVTSTEGDEIEVGGRPAVSYTMGDFRGVAFRLPNDRMVVLMARGRMAVDLVAIAERVTVEANHAEVPDGVIPDGVERLGTVPVDRLSLAIFYGGFGGADGRILAWQAGNDIDQVVAVVVQDATSIDEMVLGLLDREVEHRTVAGHSAVVSRSGQAGTDTRSIAWLQDGHLVRVITTGLDDVEAIAVAASLREVDRAEYDRLTAQVEPGPGEDVVASGGSDASSWRVYVDADRSLCIDRSGGGGCSGPTSVGMTSVDADAEPTLVAGSAPLGSTVDVTAGARSLLAAEPVELDGQLFYVAVIPADTRSVEVVITDADGTVDRRTVRTDRSGGSSSAQTTTTGG